MSYMLYTLLIGKVKIKSFLQIFYGGTGSLLNYSSPLFSHEAHSSPYSSFVQSSNLFFAKIRAFIEHNVFLNEKLFRFLLERKKSLFNKLIFLKNQITTRQLDFKLNFKFLMEILFYSLPLLKFQRTPHSHLQKDHVSNSSLHFCSVEFNEYQGTEDSKKNEADSNLNSIVPF